MGIVKVRTYHGKQGTLQPTVVDADQLVIAQPDPTGAAGSRTVNITAAQTYDAIKEVLKNTPNLIAVGEGLLGDGTPSNPIRVDDDFIKRQWVNKRFINFAQVGAQPGTALGTISGSVFYWSEKPCFLAGISQVIPYQAIDVALAQPGPIGRTVYLYLTAVNSQLVFEWSLTPRADRYDCTYLARFTFGFGTQQNKIVDSDGWQFIRFDKYRLAQDNVAETRIRGGAYPVSAGIVYEVNYAITGAIEGNVFKMINTIAGSATKQSIWLGKSSDRIMVLGAVVQVSHAYGAITIDQKPIKASLFLRSPNSDARPPYLHLEVTDAYNAANNRSFTLVYQAIGFDKTSYSGLTDADSLALDKTIQAGILSPTVLVSVVGSNNP